MKLDTFRKLVGDEPFVVKFEKSDGTLRVMNAVQDVQEFKKGTGNPINDGRFVCRDSDIENGFKGIRSFWPDSVIELKVGGKIYDGEGVEK